VRPSSYPTCVLRDTYDGAADSIGAGLLVVLQTLSPAKRLAFVLHDMFDLPFSEIAPIVGRSENTATQLAARARRRC
jgi:DNA-directed RNA polymerase specialized sigma24 family protein